MPFFFKIERGSSYNRSKNPFKNLRNYRITAEFWLYIFFLAIYEISSRIYNVLSVYYYHINYNNKYYWKTKYF